MPHRQNSAIFLQVSPALILGVSAGYYQRALVGASGMVRTNMGKHIRSDMAAVHGMSCAIPPRNSNSNIDTITCIRWRNSNNSQMAMLL
jgi:hypothetical protein